MAVPPTSDRSPPTPERWYWTVWRMARWLLVAYLAVVVLMMIFENSLIFFPTRYPDGDWNPPGLEFEDAWPVADDGTKLHGWYVPCDDPRAVAVFFHGNAQNITNRAEMLRELHRIRVSVLILGYRGYGRSEGRPSVPGILADGRAARAWLAKRENMPGRDIVLMGRSLGGAVAVDMAAEDGARALVLESTFSSMPDVAAYHYPWLPVRLLMRTRLDSADKIADYHGPLLQSHGDADRIVPYQFGRRLFEASGRGEENFITITGGDHNVPQPRHYYDRLREFLDGLE